MMLTGVQIGGSDGPWMRVGDIVRVKKTGKKGRITDINWRYDSLTHKYVGHNITLEYENPCVGYDEDEQDLTLDDVEFDILEKLARDA
jgi:hypothetical protein